MTKNRALVIITAVIAIIAVALAIFYFMFMRETPDNTGGALPIDTGTLPTGNGSGGEDLPIDGGNGQTGTTPDTSGFENEPKAFQTLRQISSLPVAGATFLEKNSETFIRYVERGSGHIFESGTKNSDSPKKISNTTIPKIYEALWNQKGQGLTVRYLKEDVVQTFYASLGQSASSSEEMELRNGTFLPVGIRSITTSPSGERVFFIYTPNVNTTYGIVSDPDGEARTQRFQSPAREWTGIWGSENSIFLYTNPSVQVEGTGYILNVRSGNLQKIISGVKGLTGMISPTGEQLLYAKSIGGSLELRVLDLETKKDTLLPIKTLPEKCTWSRTQEEIIYCAAPKTPPVGEYPDSWYQGILTFADRLLRVNILTGDIKILLEPESMAKRSMDITGISLNETEDLVLFTDHTDLSLWLLALQEK